VEGGSLKGEGGGGTEAKPGNGKRVVPHLERTVDGREKGREGGGSRGDRSGGGKIRERKAKANDPLRGAARDLGKEEKGLKKTIGRN